MVRLSRPSLAGMGVMLSLLLLILPYLAVADTPPFQIRGRGRIPLDDDDSALTKRSRGLSWRDTIKFSPAHQNPVENPPLPVPDPPSTNNSVSVNPAGRDLQSFAKRGDGPLYCTDEPCIDDSCCGPKGICGYGPDFCGDGCTSNCDALAMCGEYSENADMPCGMKLCCSASGWCGTRDVFCHNADPVHGTLPCQAGYGSCSITSPPQCAPNSGSSKGRTVGYYQSWNVRDRLCNKVSPKQLDTTGYTHLFYSFAFIDPVSFDVVTATSGEDDLIKEFVSLSGSRNLKTWIAIGGFDFSNENTATHTTWSDMVSTKANRAAFIASCERFMNKYGFTGVDLDWEYPGAPERGGRKLADTRNLTLLLREMRAAYGSRYGISLTLAPDYWYLRWFDAKGMESSVDFFGFMAYDLHGFWDADVKTLGKLVRGQADIREIANNTIPLWFDGLDPKKINFGLAMYGRGYTLADPSCNTLLCPFTGPSNRAPCTSFPGVMSLSEIKQTIKDRRITPKLLRESLMKQITWDDQWIGYDDEETFAMKRSFADSMCFGGTMIWSIDFQGEGSGGADTNGEVVYLAPEVYDGTTAQCNAPCRFVLPPRRLPSPTTISIPPFKTSVQLAPGTTTTITITVPAITTTQMEYYNYNVSSSQSSDFSFVPLPSLSVRPVTTTFTHQGTTQVRTLTLPPWPSITMDPDDKWDTTAPSGPPPVTTTPPLVIAPPKPSPTLPPGPEDPDDDEDDDDDGPPPIVTWPDMELVPIKTSVPEGNQPDKKTTCKLWFFFICIKWGDIEINGWEWNLPAGIYGPGPPPIPKIKLPPGFSFKGTLPPWPKITVAPGGQITYPSKPQDCKPADAELCMTTTSFGTSVGQGVTRTTTTKVTSTCATITGCNFQDADATRTVDGCEFTPPPAAVRALSEDKRSEEEKRATKEPNWSCDSRPRDMFIIPKAKLDSDGPGQRETLLAHLESRKTALGATDGAYYEARIDWLGMTAMYYVPNLGRKGRTFFTKENLPEIEYSYTPAPKAKNTPKKVTCPPKTKGKRRRSNGEETEFETLLRRANTLDKGESEHWHISQMCFDASTDYLQKMTANGRTHDPDNKKYAWSFDPKLGDGQTIYILESEDGLPHAEYDGSGRRPLKRVPWSKAWTPEAYESEHAHLSAAYAVGNNLGVARKAALVPVPMNSDPKYNVEATIFQLAAIGTDMKFDPENTAVVNLSYSFKGDYINTVYELIIWMMWFMEAKHGVIFTLSAGNDDEAVADYPQKRADALSGIMVVGATNDDGDLAEFSNYGPQVNVWAPGCGLPTPNPNLLQVHQANDASGTSFAAPLVAGLAAYLRSLPSTTDASPAAIRAKIIQMSRKVRAGGYSGDQNVIYRGKRDDDFSCSENAKRDIFGRQAQCEWNGGGGGSGGGSPSAPGPPIRYSPGEPGPICKENCGKLCTGYFCNPAPVGPNPDFEAPPKPSTTTQPPRSTTTNRPPPTTTSTTSRSTSSSSSSSTTTKQPEPTKQPDNPPDPNSKACRDCGDDLGASSCPWPDPESCLYKECLANKNCNECKINCDQYKPSLGGGR